jgi:nucleoside-specific channel-forming protein
MTALLLTVLPVLAAAEYHPFAFDWVQTSLFRASGLPAVSGHPVHDTVLELEGFHRHGLLDLYWFNDFPDITRSSHNDTHASDTHFYLQARPRLSLDGMLGKNLTLGVFSEWFLAYELDLNDASYGGGLRYHALGIGTNVTVKGFDYFQGNLLARYIDQDFDNPTEGTWDGWLVNLTYGRPLGALGRGWSLYFSGWLNWVVGAHHSSEKPDGCSYSLQWFNQVKVQHGRLGASYSLKWNHNFAQVQSGPGNATSSLSHLLGIHFVLF